MYQVWYLLIQFQNLGIDYVFSSVLFHSTFHSRRDLVNIIMIQTIISVFVWAVLITLESFWRQSWNLFFSKNRWEYLYFISEITEILLWPYCINPWFKGSTVLWRMYESKWAMRVYKNIYSCICRNSMDNINEQTI